MQIEYAKIPGQKLLAALEYNRNSLYSLFYQDKYYKETSTIIDYILAYFLKLHREGVLSIFDLYY